MSEFNGLDFCPEVMGEGPHAGLPYCTISYYILRVMDLTARFEKLPPEGYRVPYRVMLVGVCLQVNEQSSKQKDIPMTGSYINNQSEFFFSNLLSCDQKKQSKLNSP